MLRVRENAVLQSVRITGRSKLPVPIAAEVPETAVLPPSLCGSTTTLHATKVLERYTYPTLKDVSKFSTKAVRKYGDEYLVTPSVSPEQVINGAWVGGACYYVTVGCAYDQEMIHENGKDFLKAAELLGRDGPEEKLQREQLGHYSPIRVGWSGQIKEFPEENFYGEIGEWWHKHLSHMMAGISRKYSYIGNSRMERCGCCNDEIPLRRTYADRMVCCSAYLRLGAYRRGRRVLQGASLPARTPYISEPF